MYIFTIIGTKCVMTWDALWPKPHGTSASPGPVDENRHQHHCHSLLCPLYILKDLQGLSLSKKITHVEDGQSLMFDMFLWTMPHCPDWMGTLTV